MTARFLLHLRRWEVKHSSLPTTNGGHESEQVTTLDFGGSPPAATRSQDSSVRFGFSLDEFGEDPVKRAKTRGPTRFSRRELEEETF